jgi:hypothetical protein
MNTIPATITTQAAAWKSRLGLGDDAGVVATAVGVVDASDNSLMPEMMRGKRIGLARY